MLNTKNDFNSLNCKNVLYITTVVILFLATLLGCIVGILNKTNETEAIKQENIVAEKRVGNGVDLFKSSRTIDKNVYNDLISKIGDVGYSGTAKSQGYILKMANQEWQIVYRSNDFITLWLADCYKNSSGVIFAADIYDTWSALNGSIYDEMFLNYRYVADNIVATPYQLYQNGFSWQTYQSEIAWENRNYTDYHTLNSSLKTNESYINYKMWLPSGPELYAGNSGTDGSSATFPGIWGLTLNDLKFDSGGCCWLRSNLTSYSYGACQVYSNGHQGKAYRLHNYRVRPALHFDLTKLANNIGLKVSFNGNYSYEDIIRENETKKFTITLTDNMSVNSIVDSFGNYLNLNGSGSAQTYNYTAVSKNLGKIIEITFDSVTDNIDFTVNTSALNLVNNNFASITNIFGIRASINDTNAQITAKYLNNSFPSVNILNFNLLITDLYGNGSINSINYTYYFENSQLIFNLNNLPNSLLTVELNVVGSDSKSIIATINNADSLVRYSGNDAEVVVRPSIGYWVNSFILDGRTFVVEYKSYEIADVPNAFKIYYSASEIDNYFVLTFKQLKANINLTIICSTTPPNNLKESGSTAITGVAVTTTEGGDAKIISNSLNNEDSTQTTVTLVAWVNAGFSFMGWSTDNGVTYLSDSSGTKYGASATIPAELVKGKVVTACFTANTNNNVNTDIGNGGLP